MSTEIAQAVNDAIRSKQIPGAVVLISHHGNILLHEAYGQRMLEPHQEPMTVDTIFDMASITKPMATATCVMKLVEMGKIQLHDKAAQYLQHFGQHGKEVITIEQLLLHTSGLIADNQQVDYEHGIATAYEKIDGLKLVSPPGTRFIYSDVGYIVLGRIVEQLTGKHLDETVKEWITQPLGMKDTHFRRRDQVDDRLARIAPTEKENGVLFHGYVHDPRAQALNGIAGHAGLFSTSSDTLLYAEMLLKGGKGVLKPDTIQNMITPRYVPGGGLRNLGWDVDTAYSSPRGEHFPVGLSYGHTGFTGTSLWIDPTSDTILILLTNRVHPNGKGNATPLRRKVANIAAKYLTKKPAPSPALAGIDVLRQ
ncbi:MAG TPA: serine hydrolase domain-containing protein, partial [Gemmatales bacterium]|nr:serine hydrolase domain-containing protein [Gemmatales bacterium]